MIIFSVRDDITKKKRLIESRIQSNKYGRFKKLVSKKTRKHANTMFGFDFYIKYKIHCLVPFLSLSLRKARVLRIVHTRVKYYFLLPFASIIRSALVILLIYLEVIPD